jgi:hypothetical protein
MLILLFILLSVLKTLKLLCPAQNNATVARRQNQLYCKMQNAKNALLVWCSFSNIKAQLLPKTKNFFEKSAPLHCEHIQNRRAASRRN